MKMKRVCGRLVCERQVREKPLYPVSLRILWWLPEHIIETLITFAQLGAYQGSGGKCELPEGEFERPEKLIIKLSLQHRKQPGKALRLELVGIFIRESSEPNQ